jgi:hypothetical protein
VRNLRVVVAVVLFVLAIMLTGCSQITNLFGSGTQADASSEAGGVDEGTKEADSFDEPDMGEIDIDFSSEGVTPTLNLFGAADESSIDADTQAGIDAVFNEDVQFGGEQESMTPDVVFGDPDVLVGEEATEVAQVTIKATEPVLETEPATTTTAPPVASVAAQPLDKTADTGVLANPWLIAIIILSFVAGYGVARVASR